jgi:hypothetical protein
MTQRFEPGWSEPGRPGRTSRDRGPDRDRAPEPRPGRPPAAAQRDRAPQGPPSRTFSVGLGGVRKVSSRARSRMPLLVRTTIVVGLIAALAASVDRADLRPRGNATVTAGTAGATGQGTGQTGARTSTKRINGWTLRWDFPAKQKIIYGWNAMVTNGPAGAVATGIGLDQVIAPGGNVTVGFAGRRGAWIPTPTGFTLNGQTCQWNPSASTAGNTIGATS